MLSGSINTQYHADVMQMMLMLATAAEPEHIRAERAAVVEGHIQHGAVSVPVHVAG